MTRNDERDGDQPVSRDRREFLKGAPTAGAGLLLLGPLAGLSAEEAKAAQPRIMQGAQMAQAAQKAQAGGGGLDIKMIAYGGPFATALNAKFSHEMLEGTILEYKNKFAAVPYTFGSWAKDLVPAESWKTVDASGNVIDLSKSWDASAGGISKPARNKFVKLFSDNLNKTVGSADPPKALLFVVSTSGLTMAGDVKTEPTGERWNGYRVATGQISDSESGKEYMLLAMLCPTDAKLPI